MRTSFDKKDPFTEEIPTTTTSKAEELKKEKQRLEKENCLFRRQNYILTKQVCHYIVSYCIFLHLNKYS